MPCLRLYTSLEMGGSSVNEPNFLREQEPVSVCQPYIHYFATVRVPAALRDATIMLLIIILNNSSDAHLSILHHNITTF